MSLKLTKNELRVQQTRLLQLQRYLPTLQLKKAMLQFEVTLALMEIGRLKEEMGLIRRQVERCAPFFSGNVHFNLLLFADIVHVRNRYENIAGVEIPVFEAVVFRDVEYFLVDSPVWAESAIQMLQSFVIAREKIKVAEQKRRALEKELRDVSIRVNLFEKILIPRSTENIRKIRIFLADQQLAAVAQAKVAKRKIALRSGGI
jgi:V/A-type H+/Na+-transporting ATPase subunit D